jgi:hypothetical protein
MMKWLRLAFIGHPLHAIIDTNETPSNCRRVKRFAHDPYLNEYFENYRLRV